MIALAMKIQGLFNMLNFNETKLKQLGSTDFMSGFKSWRVGELASWRNLEQLII
jgi:hypothetical protein